MDSQICECTIFHRSRWEAIAFSQIILFFFVNLKKKNERFYNFIRKGSNLQKSNTTGWFKANLYTLTSDYDKYTRYFKKIMVELFSVHMDISFHSNKSEKITVYMVKI